MPLHHGYGRLAAFGDQRHCLVISFVVFKVIDGLVGLRVSPEEERVGLDRSEHGGEAYPEFVFQEQIADPKALDPVGSNGH